MFKSFLKANTKLKQNIKALISVKKQKVIDLLEIHKVLEFKHKKENIPLITNKCHADRFLKDIHTFLL